LRATSRSTDKERGRDKGEGGRRKGKEQKKEGRGRGEGREGRNGEREREMHMHAHTHTHTHTHTKRHRDREEKGEEGREEGRDWAWHGLLKSQSPLIVTHLLHQGHSIIILLHSLVTKHSNVSQGEVGILFLFVFRDRVSLYSPGCPGTHFVD
jgi:hypothetical protein